MDFPSKKGNEMVVPNEDGSYTILINAGLNYESQLKAYEHAMSHITNDDFLKGNVQEIEYYAHHPHKDPEPAQIYLDRIKQQLSDHGLVPEDWGGDAIMVPVSAQKKTGINLQL